MMKNKYLKSVFFLLLGVITICGCGGKQSAAPGGDTLAPVPGARINFSDTKYDRFTLHWGAASDNVTAAENLRYRVVKSLNAAAINTIAEVKEITGENVVMEWSSYVDSIFIDELIPETTYWISVIVKDEAGNMEIYYPQSTRTLVSIAPHPGDDISLTATSSTSVDLAWGQASDDNFLLPEQLQYKVVKALTSSAIDTVKEANAVAPENVVIDFTPNLLLTSAEGLLNGKKYYFAVLVKNPLDAIALYSPKSIRTLDTLSPTPGTGITFSNVLSDSITVNWGVADDNNEEAVLKYKVVRADNSADIDSVTEANAIVEPDERLVIDWTANVTSAVEVGLTQCNEYFFTVIVQDEADPPNMQIYSVESETTKDITAPTPGSGITFSGVDTNSPIQYMTINWGVATDNYYGGTTLQYQVVRSDNKSQIDSVVEALNVASGDVVMPWATNTITTQVTDLGGESYYYAVLAKDLEGNASLYTPQIQDITVPVPGVDGITFTEIKSESMKVYWDQAHDNLSTQGELTYTLVMAYDPKTVDDINEIAEVTAIELAGDSPGIKLVRNQQPMPTEPVLIENLTLGTTYYYSVLVRDKDGNKSIYTVSSKQTKKSWVELEGAGTSMASIMVSLKCHGTVPYVAYAKTELTDSKINVRWYDDTNEIWQDKGPGINGFPVVAKDDAADFKAGLAFDGSGNPCVAYQDPTDDGKKVSAKIWDGAKWVVLADRISTGAAYDISISYDISGSLHVAYLDELKTLDGEDWIYSYKTSVQKYVAGWTYLGQRFEPEANSTSLAIDTGGVSYLALSNAGNNDKAMVMKYSSGWAAVPAGNTGFSAGSASSVTLSMHDTTPYVAYVDGSTTENKATVMYYSTVDSAWHAIGDAPRFSLGAIENISIDVYSYFVDPDTIVEPYVAFRDEGASGKATVMRYNNEEWEIVGERGFSTGSVYYIPIAVASDGEQDGIPYVAFRETDGSLTVMVYK